MDAPNVSLPSLSPAEQVYVVLCLDVTVYWNGSMYDHAEGILHFYDQAMAVIGREVTFYKTETMENARPVNEETLGLLPLWLEQSEEDRDIFMLFLESGVKRNVPSERAFALQVLEGEGDENKVGGIRLVLPIDFIDGGVEPFLELAKKLVAKLHFDSGHGGYTVNWDEIESDYDAEQILARLSRRYPGIDIPDMGGTHYAIPTGLKRVNWLTFLGAMRVERFGGTDVLREALSDEIVVHDLPTGVMIQAGPAPGTGDVNRDQGLDAYHEVGRLLAPLRSPDHPPFIPSGEDDEEATEEWLGWFDT